MQKQNNFTTGTTFLKWLLKDKVKMGVAIFVAILHVFIVIHWAEFIDGLLPVTIASIASLLDVGVTTIFLYSIVEWRREKAKLKWFLQ